MISQHSHKTLIKPWRWFNLQPQIIGVTLWPFPEGPRKVYSHTLFCFFLIICCCFFGLGFFVSVPTSPSNPGCFKWSTVENHGSLLGSPDPESRRVGRCLAEGSWSTALHSFRDLSWCVSFDSNRSHRPFSCRSASLLCSPDLKEHVIFNLIHQGSM